MEQLKKLEDGCATPFLLKYAKQPTEVTLPHFEYDKKLGYNVFWENNCAIALAKSTATSRETKTIGNTLAPPDVPERNILDRDSEPDKD